MAELEDGAGVLFRQSLGEAEADLDRLRVKVGPENWPVLLAKTVEVRFGPVRCHGDVTLLAFAWQATGSGSLFPALDGDLELSPAGRGQDGADLEGPLSTSGRGVRAPRGRAAVAPVGGRHGPGVPVQVGRPSGGRPRRPGHCGHHAVTVDQWRSAGYGGRY